MSTEQRQFTPSRENVFQDILDMFFGGAFTYVSDMETGLYSERALKRRLVAEAREGDRDSRTQFVLWWKAEPNSNFERHGRHFVRQLAVDNLAQLVGAARGSVLRSKPNEELRREIALFKRVQAAREAAFEYTGRGQYGGKDVPARLGLGGLQDFTAGRENTHKRPKGYAPWRPHKKTARLMY